MYGHCQRFRVGTPIIENETQSIPPFCICIVSYYDDHWSSLFQTIIENLATLMFSSKSATLGKSPLEHRFKVAVKLLLSVNNGYKCKLGAPLKIQIPAGVLGSEANPTEILLSAPRSDRTSSSFRFVCYTNFFINYIVLIFFVFRPILVL